MPENYFIRFSSMDLGQLIDGLCVREKSWRDTVTYLREGYIPDDSFVCEECKNKNEAKSIADHYKRLIDDLQRQRKKQDDNGLNPEKQLYLDGKSDGQLNLITRIESNWPKIQQFPAVRIRSELMSLTDEICDDDYGRP